MRFKIASLLILFFLFHSINNLIILHKDNVPFVHDEAAFYRTTYWFYSAISDPKLPTISSKLKRIYYLYCFDHRIYPPFTMLLPLPFLILFRENPDIVVLVNLIYLLILISSIYGIGKIIWNYKVGLLGAFIVTTFPAVFAFSRTFYCDFALASLVTWSIYLLLKTDYFQNRKNSFLLGIAMGLGALTKTTYPIYIIGPFLFYLFVTFSKFRRQTPNTKPLLNLCLSMLTFITIAGSWYIPSALSKLSRQIFIMHLRPPLEKASFYTYDTYVGFHKLLRYLLALQSHQIYTFYFLIFMLSLIYFFLFQIKNKKAFIVLLWFLVPYSILAFTPLFVNSRHVLPILPAVGLIIAVYILNLEYNVVRKLLSGTILIWGIIHFFLLSYRSPSDSQLSIGKIYGDRFDKGLICARSLDFKTETILSVLDTSKKKSLRVIAIPEAPYPALLSNLELEVALRKMPIKIGYPLLPHCIYKFSPDDYSVLITEADYILYITSRIDKSEGMFMGYDKENHQLLKKLFEENIDKFELIKKISVDVIDNLNILIYKNKIVMEDRI